VYVSKAGNLRFLVDTGADVNLIRNTKSIGEAKFNSDSPDKAGDYKLVCKHFI
jgi:hypothetical protein